MNINYKHPEPVQHTTKRFRKLGCALCSAFPARFPYRFRPSLLQDLRQSVRTPWPQGPPWWLATSHGLVFPVTTDEFCQWHPPFLEVSWKKFQPWKIFSAESVELEICCYFLVTLHLPRFMVISCPASSRALGYQKNQAANHFQWLLSKATTKIPCWRSSWMVHHTNKCVLWNGLW